MVKFLLDLIAPPSRLWIIGQTPNQAAQDVVQSAAARAPTNGSYNLRLMKALVF